MESVPVTKGAAITILNYMIFRKNKDNNDDDIKNNHKKILYLDLISVEHIKRDSDKLDLYHGLLNVFNLQKPHWMNDVSGVFFSTKHAMHFQYLIDT